MSDEIAIYETKKIAESIEIIPNPEYKNKKGNTNIYVDVEVFFCELLYYEIKWHDGFKLIKTIKILYSYPRLKEKLKEDPSFPLFKHFDSIINLKIYIRHHERELILWAINFLMAPKIEIHFNTFIDIDLSQLVNIHTLTILDHSVEMPKEYLHHLVYLLDARKIKNLTIYMCHGQKIDEDLEEFENIECEIIELEEQKTIYDLWLKK